MHLVLPLLRNQEQSVGRFFEHAPTVAVADQSEQAFCGHPGLLERDVMIFVTVYRDALIKAGLTKVEERNQLRYAHYTQKGRNIGPTWYTEQ